MSHDEAVAEIKSVLNDVRRHLCEYNKAGYPNTIRLIDETCLPVPARFSIHQSMIHARMVMDTCTSLRGKPIQALKEMVERYES